MRGYCSCKKNNRANKTLCKASNVTIHLLSSFGFARDGFATSSADEALAIVQLYRALGGGWDPLANPETESRI